MTKLGIEQHGKVVAVVDYDSTETTLSKVLTKKAQKAYEETGSLPFGVTATTAFTVVDTFPNMNEARNFVRNGGNKKPETGYGIFKSKGQYLLAKKTVR